MICLTAEHLLSGSVPSIRNGEVRREPDVRELRADHPLVAQAELKWRPLQAEIERPTWELLRAEALFLGKIQRPSQPALLAQLFDPSDLARGEPAGVKQRSQLGQAGAVGRG